MAYTSLTEFGKDLEWLTGAPRLYIGEFAPSIRRFTTIYSIQHSSGYYQRWVNNTMDPDARVVQVTREEALIVG